MVNLKTKLEETGMRTERIRSYWKGHKGLYLLLIAGIAVLGALIGPHIKHAVAINQAWQGQNIVKLKESLEQEVSFLAKAENEAEKEVMMQVIDAYNAENGKTVDGEKYCVYDTGDGEYLITSQRIHSIEFTAMASDFFWCLGEILSGVETEEQQFCFVYVNLDQETMYNLVIMSEIKMNKIINKNKLDIIEEKHTMGEVTFVIVTVKPKSNFVPEGVVMTPLRLFI